MAYVLHAARYVDHSEPGHLLRQHHSHVRCAGTADLRGLALTNTNEPN